MILCIFLTSKGFDTLSHVRFIRLVSGVIKDENNPVIGMDHTQRPNGEKWVAIQKSLSNQVPLDGFSHFMICWSDFC